MKSLLKEFNFKKKNKLLIVSEKLDRTIEYLWKFYGGPSNYLRIAQFENDGLDKVEDFTELPYGNLFYSSEYIHVYENNDETVLIEISSDKKTGSVYSIDSLYFDILLKYIESNVVSFHKIIN